MLQAKLYLDRNLQIIFGVTLMAVMGVASITPVFPDLINEFQITAGQIGLLITVFTLPGIIFTPAVGIFADRYGRKRVLVPSLFLFAVAGAGCAFARDFNTLLILRVFQGIGAASLGSINTTIIGDLYSGSNRSEAMGLNASILSIGTAFYPMIGGSLGLLAWNYPFILPILALPIGIFVLTKLRSPEPKKPQKLKEYLGSTWQHLNNIQLVGLLVSGAVTFILLYGTLLTYFTLLLAQRFDASSFTIGLLMMIMSLTTAVSSSQLGRINRKLTLGRIIIWGFVFYGASYILIPFMPNLWLMLIPIAILGIGHGGNIPSLQTSIANLAPLEYRAAFMSVNTIVLRLGQTIGPPLMAIVYLNYGFNVTFYISGGIAFTLVLIAILYELVKKP